MPDLELHGKIYPGARLQPVGKDSRYPQDVDSVVIEVGKDRFIASAKGIDFRGVRFGDPVKVGAVEGVLGTFVDRADTIAQKFERLGSRLAEVPERIGLTLMVAKAKVMSFLMGVFSG